MFVVEMHGGEYSDKWSRVVCVCHTEQRAIDYITKQELIHKNKISLCDSINNMMREWHEKNPEYRQFYEHFKQSIPIPKWDSKNGQMTPEFRAERIRIKEENAKNAEAYYNDLHYRKELFYADIVAEMKKLMKESGFTPNDFGIEEITCNTACLNLEDVHYTYYEVPLIE